MPLQIGLALDVHSVSKLMISRNINNLIIVIDYTIHCDAWIEIYVVLNIMIIVLELGLFFICTTQISKNS